MKSTKKELNPSKQLSTEKKPAVVHSSGSAVLTGNSSAGKSAQPNLSTNIAEHLLSLMKDVTKQEVSPSTVEAACKCAQQMYNIMKLNLEMKKMGL